jgi:hypothetical protein
MWPPPKTFYHLPLSPPGAICLPLCHSLLPITSPLPSHHSQPCTCPPLTPASCPFLFIPLIFRHLFLLLQVTHPSDVFSPFVNHVPPCLLLSPVSPPPGSHISGPMSSVTHIFPTTFPLPHPSTWPLLISSPHQAVKSPLPGHRPFTASCYVLWSSRRLPRLLASLVMKSLSNSRWQNEKASTSFRSRVDRGLTRSQ